ncbi:uncharacterized protein LOC144097638 [Amblyomma americanum]
MAQEEVTTTKQYGRWNVEIKTITPACRSSSSSHGAAEITPRLDKLQKIPADFSTGWDDFPLDNSPAKSSGMHSLPKETREQVAETTRTPVQPVTINITNGNFVYNVSSPEFQLHHLNDILHKLQL